MAFICDNCKREERGKYLKDGLGMYFPEGWELFGLDRHPIHFSRVRFICPKCIPNEIMIEVLE